MTLRVRKRIERKQANIHKSLAYGFEILSDCSLGLPKAQKSSAGQLRVQQHKVERPLETKWFHDAQDREGYRICRFGKTKLGLHIFYYGRGSFYLDKKNDKINYNMKPETPKEVLQALLLTQVIPIMLAYKGYLVIHGAAILIGSKASLFLGPQGAGKSTLTAAFVKKRFAMLTDDACVLEFKRDGVYAHPSFGEIRLEAKALRSALSERHMANSQKAIWKWRTRVDSKLVAGPSKVKNIFVLQKGSKFQVCPIRKEELWRALLANCFRADITDKTQLKREQLSFLELLKHVCVYKLRYPHRFDQLSELVDQIARKTLRQKLTHRSSHDAISS